MMSSTPAGIIFKRGVVVFRPHPKLLRGAFVVSEVILDITGKQAVVTSAWDGSHSDKSLHYCGMAWDFRSKTMTPDHRDLVEESVRSQLEERWPDDYDWLLEDRGDRGPQGNEHFHLEYDRGKFERGQFLREVFSA